MLSGLHLFGQEEFAGLFNLKSIFKSEVAEDLLSFFKCMFKKMCLLCMKISYRHKMFVVQCPSFSQNLPSAVLLKEPFLPHKQSIKHTETH